MRTSRALAMVTTGLIAMTGLAACGGADALSNEDAKDALLSEDDFPLDGFKRGTVKDGKADDEALDMSEMESAFEQMGGLDKDCKEALSKLDGLKPSDHIDEGASVEFTKGSDQRVEVIVAGVKEDGEKMQDVFAVMGESCDDIEQREGGLSMKVSFDEVDEDDYRGTKITIDAMGQKMVTTMGAKLVGENFVGVIGSQVDQGDVLEVAAKQAEAVEEK